MDKNFRAFKKNWEFYILLASLFFLFYYFLHTYPYYFQSDDASRVLQAREMILDGAIFSSQWNNVNNDLLVLSSHFYVLPFLFFMEPGYLSYAYGGIFSALVMLASVWLMLREIGVEKRMIYLVLAVLAGGISPLNAQITFGQYSYGNFLTFSCLIVYFCYKLLGSDNKLYVKSVPIGVLFFVVFWSNPIRAVPTYLAPLLISLIILFIIASKSGNGLSIKKFALITASSLIGAFFGKLAHKFILKHVAMIGLPSNLVWVDFNSFISNIINLIHSVIEIFGGWPAVGSKILAIQSGLDMLHILAGVIFLIFLGWSLANARSILQRKEAFLYIFSLSSFLLMDFLVASSGMSGHRYISSSLLMVLIALLCFNQMEGAKIIGRLMVPFALLLILLGAYGLTLREFKYSAKIGVTWNNQMDNLAAYLEKSGLTYGYAWYWRANKISVISGGKVLVRAVDDIARPKPYRWLSSNNWYKSTIHEGETFLLATRDESKAIDWSFYSQHCQPPSRVLEYDEYFIYVFPQNIAHCLPDWQ